MQAASGSRKAETVYRDKQTGARMSKEDFEDAAKKASEKKKDVYEAPEWGGGVQQVEIRRNNMLLDHRAHFDPDMNTMNRSLQAT